MDGKWAELLNEILEVSPYACFFILAFAGAYFMYKVSMNNIKELSQKTIDEIRNAYKEAFGTLKLLLK